MYSASRVAYHHDLYFAPTVVDVLRIENKDACGCVNVCMYVCGINRPVVPTGT